MNKVRKYGNLLCCFPMPFLNMFKFIGNYRIALLLLKTIYQSVLLLNLAQFLTLILGVGRGGSGGAVLISVKSGKACEIGSFQKSCFNNS